MLNRKLLLGVTTVWLGSIALANGGVPTVTPETVSVPAYSGGVFVGAELLYWQPNNSKLSYGILDPDYDSSEHYPTGQLIQIKPSHEFGFSLKGGYRCPNKNMDLTVGYTRLHTGDHQSVEAPDGGEIWSRLAHPKSEDQVNKASARIDFDYDAIDFMLGKTTNPNHFDLRIAAGVRLAEVDSKFDVRYNRSSDWKGGNDRRIDVNLDSDYHGVGPRVEANGLYHFGANFGLEASVGTALLVGHGKLSEHQLYIDGGDEEFVVDIDGHRTNRVVPELDAKLGLNYTCCLSRGYSLSISAGWQAVNYFNVRESVRFLDEDHQGAYAHIVSDVSFNGPYASLLVNGIMGK